MISPTFSSTVLSPSTTNVIYCNDESRQARKREHDQVEGSIEGKTDEEVSCCIEESVKKTFGEWMLAPTKPGSTEKVCTMLERVSSQVPSSKRGKCYTKRPVNEACIAIVLDALDSVRKKFYQLESRHREHDELRASIRKVEEVLFRNQSPLFLLDHSLIEAIVVHSDLLSEKHAFCQAYEGALRGWRDQFDPHLPDKELHKEVPDARIHHARQIMERVNSRFGIPLRRVATSEEAIVFLNEMVAMVQTFNSGLPKALRLALPSKDIVQDIGLLEVFFQKVHDVSFVAIFGSFAGVEAEAPFEEKLCVTKEWFSNAHLTRITSLRLQNKGLVFVPSEIGELSALELLDLKGNHLTSIPPEIGNLCVLKTLDLSHNRLTSLPQEIGRLRVLDRLDVFFNQLAALPPTIGKLTALSVLDVSNNRLSSVPSAIGKLTALSVLDVSNNRLSSVPSAIGKLCALTSLFLHYNCLTSLPSECGNLSVLKTLDVVHNRLTALPSEIGKLGALTSLNLGHNRLSSVPSEIAHFRDLKLLNLHGNPIVFLPLEVMCLKVLWLD